MSLRERVKREVNRLLDDDEISPEEAGFMLGYMEAQSQNL